VDRFHKRAIGISNPHRCRQLAGEAHEPGITIVFRRSRFARSGLTDAGARAGAAFNYLIEDVIDLGHIFGVEYPFANDFVLIKDIAFCIGDFRDNRWLDVLTVVGQRRVTRSHVQNRHFTRTQCQRRHRLKRARDSHLCCQVSDVLRTNVQHQLGVGSI